MTGTDVKLDGYPQFLAQLTQEHQEKLTRLSKHRLIIEVAQKATLAWIESGPDRRASLSRPYGSLEIYVLLQGNDKVTKAVQRIGNVLRGHGAKRQPPSENDSPTKFEYYFREEGVRVDIVVSLGNSATCRLEPTGEMKSYPVMRLVCDDAPAGSQDDAQSEPEKVQS